MTPIVPKQTSSHGCVVICKVGEHNVDGYWAKAVSASEKGLELVRLSWK